MAESCYVNRQRVLTAEVAEYAEIEQGGSDELLHYPRVLRFMGSGDLYPE